MCAVLSIDAFIAANSQMSFVEKKEAVPYICMPLLGLLSELSIQTDSILTKNQSIPTQYILRPILSVVKHQRMTPSLYFDFRKFVCFRNKMVIW